LYPNIRVLVHATVVHLNTNAAGDHIDSVEISDPEGRRTIVTSRAVVLCAGGIENARILLYSNRVIPIGVGNVHDLVGRFLMDHPRDLNMAITIDPKEWDKIRDLFGPYMFDNGGGPREFLGGFGLSPEIQRRERLLNCAAWPVEEVSDDDPTRAAARLVKGNRANLLRDLALVATDTGLVLRAIRSRLLTQQPVRRKCRKAGFLIASEQCPNPDSRVTLSERRDRLGLPIARTDWRISHQDRQSQAVLAKTIEKEFQRLGLPRTHLADWVSGGRLEAGVLSDGCHPTGTTRMASDPRCGVVDADCRVHGVDGLYIAGSSVFPTAGHANPTLMIIAMAARLAEHLKARLSKSPSAQLPAEPNPSAHAAVEPPEAMRVQFLQSAFAEGGPTMENIAAAGDAGTHVVEPGTIVAVTGATGFIGGRLVERLVEQGAAVTCLLRGDPSPRLQRLGAKLCKRSTLPMRMPFATA
jgi:choline dehydrogenase-like flavoprotein